VEDVALFYFSETTIILTFAFDFWDNNASFADSTSALN
jgi:hypothetical protein